MSDYTPEVGHRVRVTTVFTGVIDGIRRDGTFSLRLDDGATLHSSNRHDEQTVERIPDPEPEWQKADVVRDSNGNTLIRRHSDAEFEWRNAHNEDVYRDSEVARPLTLLVRNGWSVEATDGAA